MVDGGWQMADGAGVVRISPSLGTHLHVALRNEGIASDEVRHDALRPRVHAFTLVEAHHQLPQVRFAARREVLQHAALGGPHFLLRMSEHQI
jgi:hypothetical protein